MTYGIDNLEIDFIFYPNLEIEIIQKMNKWSALIRKKKSENNLVFCFVERLHYQMDLFDGGVEIIFFDEFFYRWPMIEKFLHLEFWRTHLKHNVLWEKNIFKKINFQAFNNQQLNSEFHYLGQMVYFETKEEHFHKYIKNCPLLKKMMNGYKLVSSIDENDFDSRYFLLSKNRFLKLPKHDQEWAYYDAWFLFIIRKMYQENFDHQKSDEWLDEEFYRFPLPLLIQGLHKEPILSNQAYLNLTKSKSKFKLKSTGINNLDYLYEWVDLDNIGHKCQIIFPLNIEENKNITEDLSIMLHSLAHEILNPLSGIVAAVSVLEIENADKLTLLLDLKLIKDAITRSIDLVKLFLRFDKEPKQEILFSLSKILLLLQNRCLENNLSFQLIQNKEITSPIKMEAIYSPILFLIFNFIISFVAHRKLIDSHIETQNKKIIGVWFNGSSLLIELEDDILKLDKFLTNQLESSNFFKYLLTLKKINFEKILLSEKKLKIQFINNFPESGID